jgi:hypothetical protein
MSDARGFDPRYSPEFQRGYESSSREIPDQQHERLELRRERTAQSRVSPMPVAPVPVPDVPIARDEPRGSTASMEDLFSDDEDHADEEIEAPLWRNPYLVTLAVLGVVLTIGGVSLFRWSVDQVYAGQYGSGGVEGRDDWLWIQVAWGLSPLLAIAGALTVLGIFFFLATRWKPRRRDESDAGDEFEE